MNNFQVSWINNEGLELYSGWTDYVSAINLFREICKEKVDIDQVEARFWGENDILLKRYNNIENRYYNC